MQTLGTSGSDSDFRQDSRNYVNSTGNRALTPSKGRGWTPIAFLYLSLRTSGSDPDFRQDMRN